MVFKTNDIFTRENETVILNTINYMKKKVDNNFFYFANDLFHKWAYGTN